MKRLAVILALGALLLTGCAATPAASTPTATAKPAPYPGETASAIAAMIDGCTDVKAGDIGKGGPALLSTASCMIAGRTVHVNSWSDARQIDSVKNLIKANKTEAYLATGTNWTVTVENSPYLQLQLQNDGGATLKLQMDGVSLGTPDIPGEKSTAEAVVASIGGTVAHVPAS